MMPAPILESMPPEDRRRSPFTGWTRAHWEHVADVLLAGVRLYATPHHALLHLPAGRPSLWGRHSDGLEGFARTFLLAAFRLRGADGVAPGDLVDRYASGLTAGTDPGSVEAWPAIEDLSQPMVEAASIAIGLHETRPWIWDALPAAVRGRVVEWLAQVHGKTYVPTNWLLFQVSVNAFLKSVGAPHRQEEIDANLDRIDTMYRRDGWYTDGAGENFDHYVGWAMHLYTVLWCRMDGDRSDPRRAAEYRRRVRRFLEDFRYLFGAGGAPLHQGRSLIYRFASLAAVWAGALADATPLPPGETRRLASGTVRHFLDRGALRDRVLTMGWHDEFLPLAQFYSGPASPYWASKGFLGLLLSPDHPVWTAVEEPLAIERGDFCRAMPAPGFRAVGTVADGIVRVASHRSDHCATPRWRADDPYYRKLAYSTHTAPEVGAGGDDTDTDAQVALVRPDDTASRRGRIHPLAVADRFAASVYYPREPAVLNEVWSPDWAERIETVSIARGAAEIRIHHVTSPGAALVRDGGYAVAHSAPPEMLTGPTWSLARTAAGLTSFVAGVYGFDRAAVQCLDGANAYGRYSAAPLVIGPGPSPGERILVSVVWLSALPLDVQGMLADVVAVQVSGRSVTVHCADGECFFVQCVAAEPIECLLGGHRLRGPIRLARVSPDGSRFVLEA